jgi:E3 ubiquitin-protein ligase RGLG
MGQKDSKPSYSYSYDHGNTSSGYTSRYAGNPSFSYNARYTPSSENNVQPETHARLQRKYSRIGDDYRSLSQVTEALAQAGLESSNLIVGIDFTKSNEWTG